MSKHTEFRINGERFTIEDHNYQRNGISGTGFEVIRFHGYRPKQHFIGIVFEGKGNVAVVSLDDTKLCWRGDNFEEQLRDYIAHEDAKLTALYSKAQPTSQA